MEDPRSTWRYLQQAINGNVPKPCKATFSAKKWFNLANIKDNTSNLGALFGVSPAADWTTYFTVFIGPQDGTTIPQKVHFVARITYIVLLSDPKDLSQS